ncbi:hypothetical protein BKA61DRAFT_233413 [Leptodontidium sp. MPI-SDFR-AT-0119]|nr:hypothetical protein BKA61DRAFT_233413 [Leptodontidium sp. MPI-SDFR-AT-0119]
MESLETDILQPQWLTMTTNELELALFLRYDDEDDGILRPPFAGATEQKHLPVTHLNISNYISNEHDHQYDHQHEALGHFGTQWELDPESFDRICTDMITPLDDTLEYPKTQSSSSRLLPESLSFTQHFPRGQTATDNSHLTTSPNFAHSSLFLARPAPSPWSSGSSSTSWSPLSTPFTQPQPNDAHLSVPHPAKSLIQCDWEKCGKAFRTKTDLNHHLRYHNKSLQCPYCHLKHATKRLLDRHINERHFSTEKYYYTVTGCSRSMNGGNLGNRGRHFTREDNCKRHMRNIHQLSGTDEGLSGEMCKLGITRSPGGVVSMDESTMLIRRNRKARFVKMERSRAM